MRLNRLFSFVLCLNLLLLPAMASMSYAQGTEEEKKEEVPAKASDALGRETPRGTFTGFLKSVADEKYEQAAEYLNMSGLPRAQRANAAEYARNLQLLLDRQGWMQPDSALNNTAEGDADDELPPEQDNVASLRTEGEMTPVNVERITQANGVQIWLISADLVKKIPAMSKDLNESLIDKVTMGKLSGVKMYGAPLGHWLIMLTFFAVAYMISGMIVRAIIRVVRWLFRKKQEVQATTEGYLISTFELPLRLYATVLLASLAAVFSGVSVIVRHAIMPISITIVWIAVGLFLWGVADTLVANFNRKMAAKGRYNMTSTLAFVRRGVKVILFVIILIFILNSYGIDVTAGLAALGIGGIALALGAQKTLENFIGSLSIIIDQPIYVGDFCRIGDTTGTVEDIGMRSTRIRTNDRTLVTIPNGDLSVQRIENFARRSRYLLNRKMILRYDATSDRLRDFMARGRDALKNHPRIVKDGVILRLIGFVETGFQVDIWCNVDTSDYNEFLEVQAEITLAMVDAARDAGVYFAIPSQTFLPAIDQTGPLQKDVIKD